MLKKLTISTSLAVSVCFLMLVSNTNAQQWYDGMQPDPGAKLAEPTKETKNWQCIIGGGVGYKPTYEGSNKFEAVPIPVVSAEYKEGLVFANVRNGIGSYPLRGENYKVGASLGYAAGRDEDDDRKNLLGMGDVDPSITANLLGEYNYGMAQFTGKVSTGVSGDYGTTAEFRVGSSCPVTPRIKLTGSVGTTWADEEHMNSCFGISAAQSTRSGYRRYEAESGLKSIGFVIGANYAITKKWSANATFRGDQLMGDAADSPIVKDDFVPAIFLTTSYRF